MNWNPVSVYFVVEVHIHQRTRRSRSHTADDARPDGSESQSQENTIAFSVVNSFRTVTATCRLFRQCNRRNGTKLTVQNVSYRVNLKQTSLDF